MKDGYYWLKTKLRTVVLPPYMIGRFTSDPVFEGHEWEILGWANNPYPMDEIQDLLEIGPYLGTEPESKE